MAIRAASMDTVFERNGGRGNEFNRLSYRLCELVRCDRWQGNPVQIDDPVPPGYIAVNAYKRALWQAGWNARCALERASKGAL